MSAVKVCRKCGASLPADAPHGLCPRCLVQTAAGALFRGSAEAPKPSRPLVRYFGDYELLEEIARGGMGVVYRARQVTLNRPVAVKMILAGLFANEADRKRFQAEAETAARLNHPNIVEIYEVGEHEGQPYFSMRLVEGASLDQRMQNAECRMQKAQGEGAKGEGRGASDERGTSCKPLSILESVRIMAKASRAVHFAHQRGVLHRDLKPGNILLDTQGEPHITDFGLAKLIEGGSDLTLSGAVLGSPGYLSPEQAAGKVRQLTTAADVYGLGAVLYFLLTGAAPFTGATSVETLRRVADEEPASPRRLNPRLDSDLETICLKCLEKDSQRRYGSAEALAEDLERWLRQEPILARPVGALERFGKWVRRKPQVAALLGVIALSLAFGVASVLYEWRQAEAARREAVKHSQRAESAEKDAIEKLRDSYLAQAHANRLVAEPGRRFRSLDILAKAAAIRPGPGLRDEAIACLALTDMRQSRESTGPPGAIAACPPNEAWDQYAVALPGGDVSIRSLGDDRELVRLPSVGSEACEFPGFSHTSRWLGIGYKDGKCRVWDLKQRSAVITAPMFNCHQGLAFRAGDGQVAVIARQRTVRIFETATGKLIRSFMSPRENYCVAYSPDGSSLAVSDGEGSLKVYEADTGRLVTELRHPKGALAIAWHPGGRLLATTCGDRLVRIWDVAAARELHVLAGHGEEVHEVAFHPAGELLVSTGFEGAMLWDVQTGQRLFVLPGARFNPTFAASGDRLYSKLFSPAGFDLWEIATDNPVHCFGSKTAFLSMKAVTFLENRLVAFADGRTLCLLDLISGRELAKVEADETGSLDPDAHGQYWTTSPIWGTGQEAVRRGTLRRADAGGEWVLSSPEPALENGATGAPAPSKDGELLAFPYGDHCRVIETATGAVAARTPGKVPTSYCAFSPDSRWVATGARRYTHLHIWEWVPGQTNLVQRTSFTGDENPDRVWGARPRFSEDGRRLAVHWGPRLAFYETAQWKELWSHEVEGGSFALTPDGRLVALQTEKRHIHLLAADDGTVLATLEMPNLMPVQTLAFSPDSTLLAAVSSTTGELFVWDLPVVRRELARLGLDWEGRP